MITKELKGSDIGVAGRFNTTTNKVEPVSDITPLPTSTINTKTIVAQIGTSHNTTDEKKIFDKGAVGEKSYIFGITISTVDITAANVVQILDGSGGSVLWELELGEGLQGESKGWTIGYAFRVSNVDKDIYLKLSAAQKVTYDIGLWQE